MNISRRSLLKLASATAAAGLIPGSSLASSPSLLPGFTAPHLGIAGEGGFDGGFADAKAAHGFGGRILRVFYTPRLFSPLLHLGMDCTRFRENGAAILAADVPEPTIPVYMDSIENRLLVLDRVDRRLDETLQHLPSGNGPDGSPLQTDWLDSYLRGIEAFNVERPPGSAPMRVLLCLVLAPARDIVEAPPRSILEFHKKSYSYNSLWHKHCQSHIDLTRYITRRYMTHSTQWDGRPREPIVTAIELINEPDYHFLPDEVRIEEALRPEAQPLEKYVTELHLQQIPSSSKPTLPAEKTAWGFVENRGEWDADVIEHVGVLDYNWGKKFDWYVRSAADLIRHMSFAAKSESSGSGVNFTVMSGGVTHNNIDYLIRMYKQNGEVFRWCDAIALHPYHWPQHNIWASNFVDAKSKAEWRSASPNEFAKNFLKRFDFIEEIASLTKMNSVEQSFGLAGKRIWVTEFGLGTKKLGEANRPLAKHIKFIKQRDEQPLPFPSVDWEDIWDEFLLKVDRSYLDKNNIETFIFYALRETEAKHLDRNDQDRTNFSILRKSGEPRMAQQTAKKLRDFISSFN